MVRQEVIDYIRKIKGQFSDEEIKQRLLQDGISLNEIEDAFRVAAALSPAAPDGPVVRRPSSWGPAVFFCVVVFTILAAVALRQASHIGGPVQDKSACELNSEQKAQVQAEIDRHEPGLYGYPSNVDAFLPGDFEEGDAGEPMLDAVKLVLEAGGVGVMEGLATKGYRIPAPIAAGALPKLEAGIRYGDNLITGGLIVPESYREAGVVGVVAVILSRLGDAFLDRSARYFKEDNLPEAEAEAKKAVALGLLLMKDWSNVSQAMGAAVIMDGFKSIQRVHGKLIDNNPGLDCVVRRMEIAKVAGMLAKEMKNFMVQPEETKRIGDILARPQEIPQLKKYLDSPTLRQHYAELVLLGVVDSWSPEEILAGRPHPARKQLLNDAAKHKDGRLAALAAGFGRAFNEVAELYARLSREDRNLVAAGKQARAMSSYMTMTSQDRLRLLMTLVSRRPGGPGPSR